MKLHIKYWYAGFDYKYAQTSRSYQLSKVFGKLEPGFTHRDWKDRLRGYDINDWLLLFDGERFNVLMAEAVVSFGKMQHTVLR